MLGRISRGLGHKSGGRQGVKYRFDVVVEKLDNLPGPVKRCRVVWSRGAKLQMTEVKDVNKGAVLFKQKLSQIATLYRDPKGGWEAKEYKFQVQVPGKEDGKLLSVGRADLDVSLYVLAEGTPQAKMIPVLFKVGMASTGYLKVSITAELVAAGGPDSEDGMTEVSGLTGMTANLGEDQDLSGFDEDRSAAAQASSRPSPRLSTAVLSAPPKPAAAAAGSSQGSTSMAASSIKAKAAAAKPVPAGAKGLDEDEISPMSMSPSGSEPASPREASGKPLALAARAAGKPSVIDKAAAAADARSQLFGASKPTNKPVASTSTSSSSISKPEPTLTEDEARAALFAASSRTAAKRSSAAPSPKGGSSSSKPAPAPDPVKPGASVRAAASAAAGAGPSRSSSVAASETSASTGAAPGVRRALLDRSALQERQQAQAGAGSSEPSPSSSSSNSKQVATSAKNTHGHSLSDSDDDSMAEQQQQVAKRQAGPGNPAHSAAAAVAAAASRSKQPGQPPSQPQPPPQAAAAADASSSAAAKALSADNEKLRAQLVALRQQAVEAEESRRMAVLAADNAASERDEYFSQVQELQEQLKEALVSLVPAEEAAELRQELQALKQLLAHQQERQQAQELQQQTDAKAWQAERTELQQQVEAAQHAAATAQEEASKQMQQLQADAGSQAGLIRHLSWQLEAAQQALQQQQQQPCAPLEQQPQAGASASTTSPAAQAAEVAAAQDRASSAERHCGTVLELLADEVQALSQHSLVHQCTTDQLLMGVAGTLAALDLDGAVQGPVMEVLAGLRAAQAALQQQAEENARLNNSVRQLTATHTEVQLAASLSDQAGKAAAAELQQSHAQVAQLRQQNEHLALQLSVAVSPSLTQAAEHETAAAAGSPKTKAVMRTDTPAVPQEPCKECVGLQQQLAAAQHRVTKLTAARDKLEIILHDLETISADECQQLEQQLAAANKALRSTSQQLASAQQQLTHTQQELDSTQLQLQEAQQQLAHAHEQHEALQQQTADAAAEVQQLQQRLASGTVAAAEAAVGCVPAQVIAMAESAGPSGVEQALSATQEQAAELQRQLTEAEGLRRGLETELGRVRKQLADEQSERSTLEEHMVTRLEDMGDDVAQETVAAYEAKYNRLKSRYRELTELHREEVDRLHEEIGALQERVGELEALAAQLESAKTQAQHGEVTLADTLAKAGKATSELTALRSENQMLMQTLIDTKLHLALCCEREVVGRHELYKARETNLKLASKMTRLETLVYATAAGGGGKKA